MRQTDSIPVLDLSLPDDVLSKEIHEACSTYGFFYGILSFAFSERSVRAVKNHGIDLEFVDKVFEETRRFFALPLDEKLKIQQNVHDRGYVPPKAERLDVKAKCADTKERINFGLEDLEGVLPLRGPNLWPDQKLVPEFKPTMESYFDQVYSLAKDRLTRLMALSLNLEATAFDSYVKDPAAVFHPLHYLSDLSNPDAGLFACSEHSDYGIVTVLATDEVGGLQIKLNGEWIDVPYKKDAFIINIGDMVERLTNGIYKSTVHRVLNTHGKERYSIPFFLNPNTMVDIEPLPQFCENGQRFPKISYGDYLINKYRTTNDGYIGPQTMEKVVPTPMATANTA